MRRIFDFEGPFFSVMSRFADLIWLNILYLICCIPVVTAGAAKTALYYVTLKMIRQEDSHITRQFFKSFKDNFKQATIIWLLYLVIAAVLICDLVITGGGSLSTLVFNIKAVNDVVLVAVGIITILLAFTLTYVFPLLAQFDNTVRNTIKNAFLISIRHLPYTILFLIIWAVPYTVVGLSYYYGNGMGLMLVFIMYSVVAYLQSKYFVKIFKLYMPKEEVSESAEDEHIFEDEQVNDSDEDNHGGLQ